MPVAQNSPTNDARLVSVSMPNLPTANAIAPKAPIGARYMTILTMPNTTSPIRSIASAIGCPRSPSWRSAMANTSETNSTCSTLPPVNAPTALSGTIAMRKSYQCSPDAMPTYCLAALESCRSSGFAFRPVPGWNVSITTRPTISAIVVIDLEVDERLDAHAADARELCPRRRRR